MEIIKKLLGKEKLKILALSPHTDDSELGAGGTLARFGREGHKVSVIAFSTGDTECGASSTEFLEAMEALGVHDREVRNYDARNFPSYRQDILNQLHVKNLIIEPDIVFIPSKNDIHQDHQVIAAEAERAFRRCCVLAYELTWSTRGFLPQLYVKLSEEDMSKKMAALMAYESQKTRHYMNPMSVLATLDFRGAQIDHPYAEAFEVVRWMI